RVMLSARRSAGPLLRAALLFLGVVGQQTPVMAGSDNSTDVYAGDYALASLPSGTFVAAQYLGYFHSDAFIDSARRELPNSRANIFEEFTRFGYLGEIGGHKWVVGVEVPSATLTDVNVPGTNNLVAGGFTDPVLDFSYFLVADAQIER